MRWVRLIAAPNEDRGFVRLRGAFGGLLLLAGPYLAFRSQPGHMGRAT
jgi:hypothetical protein